MEQAGQRCFPACIIQFSRQDFAVPFLAFLNIYLIERHIEKKTLAASYLHATLTLLIEELL
jgi:hypothetical protein